MTFNDIRPGDMVKFLIPNGIGRDGIEWKVVKGRAVICESQHVVVNIGGQYGTPKVVNAETYLSHKKGRS